MLRKNNKSEFRSFLKKVSFVTIVVMIGMALGMVLASTSKDVKRIPTTQLSKDGDKDSRYIAAPTRNPSLYGSQGSRETPAPTVPQVGAGAEPRGLQVELSAAPYDLIPQHQEAYLQKIANSYENDNANPKQGSFEDPAPESERLAMLKLTTNFVNKYETFSNAESFTDYRATLIPYVAPSALNRIAYREDNHQPKDIGLRSAGGTSGSTVSRRDGNDPASSFVVIRYDDSSAYVTTVAIIRYTGPNAAWGGAVERRSYGIILVKDGGHWRVTRAASDTLGPIED